MFSAIQLQVLCCEEGVSLQEIAAVLRHRSLLTTEIYAKVDVVSLRQIAQPWPEVKTC
jgi:site-specific recombinase XerD